MDGEFVIDDCIRYERLEEDFSRICKRLDLEVAHLPPLKTKSRGEARIDYRTYYDAQSRDRVAEAFAAEIEHFGWSFN